MNDTSARDLTFLHVTGSLTEQMVYRPRRGHESTRPGARQDGDPAYRLRLLDRDGRLLVESVPALSARGCGTAHEGRRWRVRGTLALHPAGVRYQLCRGDILLHEADVASAPPVLERARVHERRGAFEVEWTCAPADGVSCDVAVVMTSGRRIVVAKHVRESRHIIALDRLPEAGDATVVVVAGDGVRSREMPAGRVHVPARPPTLHILQPAPDEHVPYGQPVSVVGACLDMAGHPMAGVDVTWRVDGDLVEGVGLLAALTGLDKGTHRVSMACAHGDDRLEIAQTFVVDDPDEDRAD